MSALVHLSDVDGPLRVRTEVEDGRIVLWLGDEHSNVSVAMDQASAARVISSLSLGLSGWQGLTRVTDYTAIRNLKILKEPE